MGYRTYINVVSKEFHNKVKDLTLDEYVEQYGIYDICFEDESTYPKPVREIIERRAYCLGKWVEIPLDNAKRGFFSKEVDDALYEYEEETYILNKDYFTTEIIDFLEKDVNLTEVLHYYRNIDWDKNFIIYYGW